MSPPPADSIPMQRQWCRIRRVLDRVGDKWSMLAVGALRDGPLRSAEVRRRIEGISQKMLTRTLRGLEREGFVQRTEFPTVPPSVEYRLTQIGDELSGLFELLRAWTYAHVEGIERAILRYGGAGR